MIIAALVVFGLILGSFVNALVWRFHEQDVRAEQGKPADVELSMMKGRSMCSHCHHPLAPKDLIPLLSWLYLRGKCRYCRVRIQDNPLLEAGLPVLYIISFLAWPRPLQGEHLLTLIFWLVFLVGFLALAAYDLRWFLLPDRIVFPLIGLAVVELLVRLVFFHGGLAVILGAMWGVAICSGLFWLLYRISDGAWIGGGDVKLGIVLGLIVGGPLHGFLLLFIASTVGSLVSLPLLLVGKAARKTQLPFGPFLLLAAF